MASETFTLRVDAKTKERLEKLAEATGRSRSFLAGEAITAFLDANEWQISGVKAAIESIEDEGAVAHEDVAEWISSWGTNAETAPPKPDS